MPPHPSRTGPLKTALTAGKCYSAAAGEFLLGIGLLALHRLAIGYKYGSLTESEYRRLLFAEESSPFHMRARNSA